MIKELWEMSKEELIEARDVADLDLLDLQDEMDGVQDKIYRIEDELLRRKNPPKAEAK